MFQSVLQESPSPNRDAQWFGLTQDFLHNAITYGKIIISETFIPTRSKTIPPIPANNSGEECYEVYIHKGILYKLYLDTQKNFGSTHHAMKVASNEMKGWRSLYKCNITGLYFPFSIQIDFQGFRLLAQSGTTTACRCTYLAIVPTADGSRCCSVLPIDDTRTIAYGSSGDCTIHNDSEELDCKMTEAGISLNLKKHLVGDKEMALAADIEGHCGTVRRPLFCGPAARSAHPTKHSLRMNLSLYI